MITSSKGVSPATAMLGSGTGVSPVKPPEPASDNKRLADLKKACEQFEAVFAKKLLGEMRKGVQETPLGDSAGSEIYRDMMDQALADAMSSQGALGIAKMLYKQFETQVAAAISPPAPGGEGEPKRAGVGQPAIGLTSQAAEIQAGTPAPGRYRSLSPPGAGWDRGGSLRSGEEQ